MTRRIVLTAGEPAGIGPELMLSLADYDYKNQLVVSASLDLLAYYAKLLHKNVTFIKYEQDMPIVPQQKGYLTVLDTPLATTVTPGMLDKANGNYVLQTLEKAAYGCLQHEFAALVTGPVHKGIINEAGIPFTGHTEFFQHLAKAEEVVMMLATDGLRVALATTHLPLKDVSTAITKEHLTKIITILHHDLQQKFGISQPQIYLCGLNPHAGEGGHLGHEELDVIIPVMQKLQTEANMHLYGPYPADTIFQPKILEKADAILAMYHDQGLPVLKYRGFGNAVNITLGLPFIRTSVDHGTALDLAGKGIADTGSLHYALKSAEQMIDASLNKA